MSGLINLSSCFQLGMYTDLLMQPYTQDTSSADSHSKHTANTMCTACMGPNY
jgi:hypothetical protein